MIRGPPRSTRTDTLFPYTPPCRSADESRGTNRFVLALLSSGALAGCSTMPDLVHSTVPVGAGEDSPSAFQTIAEVKARVMVKKQDLAQRMRNQELARKIGRAHV